MTKTTWEDLEQQLPEHIHDLYKDLQEGDPSKYLDFLTMLGRLHNYSARNVMLVLQQRKDATMVAGYTRWRDEFGRQVKKGAKCIHIQRPVMGMVDDVDPVSKQVRRDPVTGKPLKKKIPVSWAWCRVFDVSDTEGEDLPVFQGNDAQELLGRLQKHGMSIDYDLTDQEVLHFQNHFTLHLSLRDASNLSLLLILRELAFEHLKAEDHKTNRQTAHNVMRMEALAIAEAICRSQHIDNTEYVSSALQCWTLDPQEQEHSFHVIGRTVKFLLQKHTEVFLPEQQEELVAV